MQPQPPGPQPSQPFPPPPSPPTYPFFSQPPSKHRRNPREALKIAVGIILLGIGLIPSIWALSQPPGAWSNFNGWLKYNWGAFYCVLFLAILGAVLLYRVVASWAAAWVPSGREGKGAGPRGPA